VAFTLCIFEQLQYLFILYTFIVSYLHSLELSSPFPSLIHSQNTIFTRTNYIHLYILLIPLPKTITAHPLPYYNITLPIPTSPITPPSCFSAYIAYHPTILTLPTFNTDTHKLPDHHPFPCIQPHTSSLQFFKQIPIYLTNQLHLHFTKISFQLTASHSLNHSTYTNCLTLPESQHIYQLPHYLFYTFHLLAIHTPAYISVYITLLPTS